ncbi:MAG: hypothetical protein ACK56I_05775, partial [bacterium]
MRWHGLAGKREGRVGDRDVTMVAVTEHGEGQIQAFQVLSPLCFGCDFLARANSEQRGGNHGRKQTDDHTLVPLEDESLAHWRG